MKRRKFVKDAFKGAALSTLLPRINLFTGETSVDIDSVWQSINDFKGIDSYYHGDMWESLNPGYWQIKDRAIRRKLVNIGDRARSTGFPYHYKTGGQSMNTKYDPSAPLGFLWRRDWYMSGDFILKARFIIKGYAEKREEDGDDWKMYQKGFGAFGLAIGAKTQFEAGIRTNKTTENKSILSLWSDDDTYTLGYHVKEPNEESVLDESPMKGTLKKETSIEMTIKVSTTMNDKSFVETSITQHTDGNTIHNNLSTEVSSIRTEGYIGICGKGNIDFELVEFEIGAGKNRVKNVPVNECHMVYALGDTLKEKDGNWTCRFIAVLRNEGKFAEIRVSENEQPTNGWENVKPGGVGKIITNDFRRNTVVIDVKLPGNPAESTFYYTIWKDGENITSDPRIGTRSTGPGTGMVGDVPLSGQYVGRLPQLSSPYKVCGLSCHAINGNNTKLPLEGRKKTDGTFDVYFVRDQPTYGCYKYLEDFNFQIMLWEDDVWYMELLQYPLSTDDAYKIVTITLGGPASRWQMMRHWNVINPGDHDHGMDDVKGPEQLLLRNTKGLGQDPSYMIRNFQIVSHLMIGKENPTGTDNPKRWRKWKMPNRDFTLAICDSRLWRTSQDTDIWDDSGWGEFKDLYSRKDPTRVLLGEEQFSWLTNLVKTDSSPLICLTGINGLHAIWNSGFEKGNEEWNRVAADYAYWVKAGVKRVIELLGSRPGITSVYGDVHNGTIMRNKNERFFECSFGPIGRGGGRRPIPGFGRNMVDLHDNELEIISLYHQRNHSPDLDKEMEDDAPYYWNFLEATFDSSLNDPEISLKVRNLIDSPIEKPRGDGNVNRARFSDTGRKISSRIPEILTIPNADVQFDSSDGSPILAIRSLPDGSVPLKGLIGIKAGEKVRMSAFDGDKADAQIIVTF